jgi:phosphatidylglycerol lysyltransferase
MGGYQFSRQAAVALGLVLLYLSLQLVKRKRIAFILTTISLTLLLIFELAHPYGPVHLLLYLITFSLLLWNRREYDVANDNLSLRRGLGAAAAILIFACLYGTIGFYLLRRREFGYDFDLLPSLKYSFLQLFTFQDAGLIPHSRYAKLFLDSLNAISITALALAVGSIFKPIRFALGTPDTDRKRAEDILGKYSTSVEDYFKLWPADKHYFFSASNDAFLAYKISGSKALILDGPSGNPKQYAGLLEGFTTFAASNGWSPVIIHGDGDLDDIAKPLRYRQLFIGNEALVDVEAFATKTYRSKHFRYIQNKASREELAFTFWEAPLTRSQANKLSAISKQWLKQNGRREYTFLMGYFDPLYIRQCSVAVLLQAGKPVAYTNLIPTFVSEERSIDHMRYVPNMSSSGMHYLLMQLILYIHTQGVKMFNLGLSPLSGIEDLPDASLVERFLRSVKTIGRTYYSFGGLEQFKNKFEPIWQPRYIYYQGLATNLLSIAQGLNRATAVRSANARRKFAIIASSLVAAVTYVSFPLGYILNPHSAGLVSDLGGIGQPYAWVFNGLDIVSGLSTMFLGFLLWTIPEKTYRRPIRFTITLLVVAGLSNILAATTPLAGATGINFHVLFHDTLSGTNFACLISAVCVFMFRTVLPNMGRYFSVSVIFYWSIFILLLMSAVMSLIFQEAYGSGLLQRVYICLAALWIPVLGISLSRNKD